MGNKHIDETWDYRTANTKTYTHCFHSYPAMMIPQVARRLIDLYGKGANLLFDPYCGTGTSLVEASLKSINSIGTELNPIAKLIALSKVADINIQVLDLYLKDFNNFIFSINFGLERESIIVSSFNNIDYWFDKNVQNKLSVLKSYIDSINNVEVSNFFKVAFSETVRNCSWTRNNEFKLLRMTEKQMDKFNPDVFKIMETNLARNKRGLIDFIKEKRANIQAKVFNFNTVDKIPDAILPRGEVDIVVTSPPYGDSRTTVAYGQFSRLSAQWIGFEKANQIDNLLMGGKRERKPIKFNSKILNTTVDKLLDKDVKRAKEVIAFYNDYKKSIDNISKIVKLGGFICYVVGNRSVKGIVLPTDEITKDFFEENNFKHIKTIIRNIPNKRMPYRNSPSNISGHTAFTMKNEYIVILQKE